METIIRGFKDYMSQFVIEREPKTMTQALHFANLAQSIKTKPSRDDALGVAQLAAQTQQTSVSTELAALRTDMSVMATQPAMPSTSQRWPQSNQPTRQAPRFGPTDRHQAPRQRLTGREPCNVIAVQPTATLTGTAVLTTLTASAAEPSDTF